MSSASGSEGPRLPSLKSTDTQFGELLNVISGSSTSLRNTKQLYLNGYMRTNVKGRFQQIYGHDANTGPVHSDPYCILSIHI